MDRSEALDIIKTLKKSSDWQDNEVQRATEILVSTAETEGLTNEELVAIASIINSNKLGTAITKMLFRCLIPETKVPSAVVEELLPWVFFNLGTNHSVDQFCLNWILGLLRYDLIDKTLLRPYFHQFIFMILENGHVEQASCSILHYLTRQEDLKRFYVTLILNQWRIKPSHNLKALLSHFKSCRPELVSEDISPCTFHWNPTVFDKLMEHAGNRCRTSISEQNDSSLKWRTYQPASVFEKRLSRLVPAVEHIPRKIDALTKSVTNFKTEQSLLKNLTLTRPTAQTMALLANEGGFKVLAFSDPFVKATFCSNLKELLETVILRNSQYSPLEEELLVSSVASLLSCIRQSLHVVQSFLIDFLLIWDGMEFADGIFALLEWFTFQSADEWEKVAPALQSLFRSSCSSFRIKLLNALTNLLSNTVEGVNRNRYDLTPLFIQDFADPDPNLIFTKVAHFVHETAQELFTCSKPENTREVLIHILHFYEKATQFEDDADLPIMTLVPSCVVYACIFSSSVENIERLCSLLLKYQSMTLERLLRLGVFEEFRDNFGSHLSAYFIDIYRALFSGVASIHEFSSGLLREEFVQGLRVQYQLANVEGILCVKTSPLWKPVGLTSGGRDTDVEKRLHNYPSLRAVKKFVEERLDLSRTSN